MQKHFFSLVCFLFASMTFSLPAAGLHHDFTKKDAPASQWTMINWKDYKPHPKIVHNKEKGYLHISNVAAKSGFGMTNHKTKIKTCSPDTVRIRFTGKGKGRLSVGLQYFSRGRFSGCDNSTAVFLTPEWKMYELDLPVRDLNGKTTDQAMIAWYGSKQGELFLRDFHASAEKSRYAGNLFMPANWTVFPLVDSGFVPEKRILSSIPAQLNGVQGKKVEMLSNTLDFAKITGKKGMKLCSWAFAEINSQLDNYECTFGVGADWWMTFYVNGKEVLSTMQKGGNIKHPIAIDNHLVKVKLKRGRNILAFKFISGSTSSILKVGGPRDLRNIVRAVKITEKLLSDDFDRPLKRKDLHRLIRGNPAPGLMIITGQGLYRADQKEAHIADGKNFSMKKDHFFAMGIRIQQFGEKKSYPGTLIFHLAKGKEIFEVHIDNFLHQDKLSCSIRDRGKTVLNFLLDKKKLPADILFAFQEEGAFLFSAGSLSDSTIFTRSGSANGLKAFSKGKFSAGIFLKKHASAPAEIIVDELQIGHGKTAVSSSALPYTIDHARTFDPVKAKWPLVFSDEFNGNQVDESKWIIRRNKKFASVKNGLLHIKADYGTGKNKGKLDSASLWTRKVFRYGYFEARLRFTHQPGWWAAFWLYTMVNANPFMDGFEIDIFEDYYNRNINKNPNGKGVLDHNLHINTGSVLKSWNYNSTLPGSIRDFYVLGCKWTPFEISYYINGKLISSSAGHSPYDSVTYDAFHHSAGITPLQLVLSGCIMGPSYHAQFGAPSEGKFPEYFLVDHVRVYAMPQQDLPQVTWKSKPSPQIRKMGSLLRFQAEVKKSPRSKAPIKAVYLFDNGYMLAYKEKAPYTFEIPFTEAFYKTTRYTRPGRSRKPIPFDTYPHAFTLFVQDQNGMIAHSEPHYVIPFVKESTPYNAKGLNIPGTVLPGDYDKGGQNVAYFDTTRGNHTSKNFRPDEDVDTNGRYSGNNNSGEWRNYTLNVNRSAVYTAVMEYGTPLPGDHKMLVFIDGRYAGAFAMEPNKDPNSWACRKFSKIDLKLEKGIRKMTLLVKGGFNQGPMQITEKAKP